MSKAQRLTLLAIALFIPACASSPASSGLASARPDLIDCRRVAQTGSRIKSRTVCGEQPHGQILVIRGSFLTYHDL